MSLSATSRMPGSSCRSTPTPTTRSAATSSASSGGCRSEATRSSPTGTRSGSRRCGRTASRRSGSAAATAIPSAPPPNFIGQPRDRSNLWRYRMWVVRLTDKQLEVLRALLRSEEHLGPALKGAVEALDLARWDDLPEAELPWGEIETVARRQGISEADVIWDISGGRKAA